MKTYFTSESVTKGHPDKVSDQISDAILTEALKIDENSKVAVEVALKNNLVLVFGEITTNANLDYEKIIRETIISIGYNEDKYLFNGHNVKIMLELSRQSNEIAEGVNKDDQGAGDQGIMFGYASNETQHFMPASLELAHMLAYRLTEVREKNFVKGLRPDGKTQVTTIKENGKIIGIDTIVISSQHDEDLSLESLTEIIKKEVINKVIPSTLISVDTKILINPAGSFSLGGPAADSGLTGRKIIVDSFGGYAAHGGGAFSGKDPSKVDRSGAYMMRYLAKNIVASGLAAEIEIQIAYAIGVAKPVSLSLTTYGTNKVSEELILETIKNNFDLRPKAIIDKLQLTKQNYLKTAAYGHFGFNTKDYPWEQLDSVELFKKLIK